MLKMVRQHMRQVVRGEGLGDEIVHASRHAGLTIADVVSALGIRCCTYRSTSMASTPPVGAAKGTCENSIRVRADRTCSVQW
jgi:hypothetical protein